MANSSKQPGLVRNIPKFSEFKSLDAIAKALLNNYPHIDWNSQARSLAVKIGNLDAGRNTWWISRPKHSECLAEILNTSLEDLGLHESSPSDPTFHFEDFPELPPIIVGRDKNWNLGFAKYASSHDGLTEKEHNESLDHWFNPPAWARRPPYAIDWLYVEDKLERDLLAKKLAAAGSFDVLFCETLTDMQRNLAAKKPLIIVINSDSGDSDFLALALRPEGIGVLVIAPFMLQKRIQTTSAEYMSWELISSNGDDRDIFELSAPDQIMSRSVCRWTWTLYPNWRSHFLNWMNDYVEKKEVDTLFSDSQVSTWLSKFDPSSIWFSKISDMMQLCRVCHNGIKSLPQNDNLSAGSILIKKLLVKEKSSIILQITELAIARWIKFDQPWLGGLPLDAWKSCMPQSLATLSTEDLESIATGKNQKERQATAVQVAKKFVQINPDFLIENTIIKHVNNNLFDFQHRSFASLAVRDWLMQELVKNSLNSWSVACFDDSRRAILDAALDAISMSELIRIAENLQDEAPCSPIAIGVSEALFTAVARRILKYASISEKDTLKLTDIAKRVIIKNELWTINFEAMKPWTRPYSTQDEKLNWITACWAWSFLIDPPIELNPNWQFPGWNINVPEFQDWLEELWPNKDEQQPSLAWVNFLNIIDQWAIDMDHPIINAPRVIKISLIHKAGHGLLNPHHSWWEGLVSVDQASWIESELLKRIQSVGKPAASRLWPSFLQFEQVNASNYLIRFSKIRRWLLSSMNTREALENLNSDDIKYLASVPESLPPELRSSLLLAQLENFEIVTYENALPFLKRFGSSVSTVLIHFLDHPTLADAAAQCLWDWEAESTARLLDTTNKLSAQAKRSLILSCPVAHLKAALNQLDSDTTLLDECESIEWAKKYLSNSGAYAEKLIQIISKHQNINP